MKNIFIKVLGLVLVSFSGLAVFAAEISSTNVNEKVNSMSRYISPCTSWSMNPSGSGYVCNYYDTMVEVVDAYEVRRFAQQVEQKLSNLETRITILESK
jgi:hypothetical protein